MIDWQTIQNIPWGWLVSLLPVSYIGGILTKPAQETLGRWLQHREEKTKARKHLYKELAWNIRQLTWDTWNEANHLDLLDHLRTEMYDKYVGTGLLHELKEGTELMECMEFFKTARQFRGVPFYTVTEICGDFLWGFEYSLTKGDIDLELLKSVASEPERQKIAKLLETFVIARAENEAEAAAYLEKRKAKELPK